MRRRLRWLAALAIGVLPTVVSAQDKFFDSKGVQIRYVDIGKGEPVVLLHGLIGSIESNWIDTGVLANLSRDHRVIAFDMRGHGKSGKPHDRAQYGRKMSEDVVRLLDHLRIQKAHIVGYSMGGRVTSVALITHPERFVTTTFGGSAPSTEAWTEAQEKRTEQVAAEFEQGSLRSLITGNAPAGQVLTHNEIEIRSAQELKGQDRMALAQVRRSYKDFIITGGQLASIRIPMMAIVGSDDPALSSVQAFKKLRTDVKVVVIDGATHHTPRNARERPEFVRSIREFVAAHRRASAK